MNPELGWAGFRIGCLLVIPSVILLLLLAPGTAEYSITVVTLVVGLVFTAAVTAVVVRSQR